MSTSNVYRAEPQAQRFATSNVYRAEPQAQRCKTYFWISKETAVSESSGGYTFNFPPEFIANRNRKHIVIEECKATFKSQLVGDVIMHADFIHRDHYLDHACCFVNEDRRNLAKYEYDSSTKQTFRIWFTDLHGDIVDIDAFVVRALLITA